MGAPKAEAAVDAVPEKVMLLRLGETLATVKPCDCSQASVLAMSASARPKRAPNSAGVSHWWYWGEDGSCCAATSASRSACCCALRLKYMVMDWSGMELSTTPMSWAMRAPGGCDPASVAREVFAMGAAIRA